MAWDRRWQADIAIAAPIPPKRGGCPVPNRAAHLFALAEAQGGKAAVIFEDKRIDFATLAARVRAAAGGLALLGVGRGTRVGILLPSSPEFIVIQQAAFALGAIVSPLNVQYRAAEVAEAVTRCDLEYLVSCEALHASAAVLSSSATPTLRSLISVDAPGDDRAASLARAIASGSPLQALAAIDAADPAMLLLTSATSGKAKGVILTAANLAANYDRTPGWLGIGGDDVILCALPLYNTFGLNQCINAMLVTGATMVVLPRFDAQACVDAITHHGCTFLPAVPTMLQRIVDAVDARPGALASLRRILTGGAPVPAALLRRVIEAAPHVTVLTGYGLTEATALATMAEVRLGDDGEVVRGRTIGRVLDGMALAILDPDGAPLAPGEVGEIALRGPNLMRGYHRAPEDSAAALVGGWLRTGDLGYVDADGYAYIVDRKKDVIIRGGQNIYPADIEEVLYGVVGVAEAAVVGVADPVLGEVPVAFVALRPGATVSVVHLLERCGEALARYKHPAAIHIMAELPKGPTGKILRRALRASASPNTSSATWDMKGEADVR